MKKRGTLTYHNIFLRAKSLIKEGRKTVFEILKTVVKGVFSVVGITKNLFVCEIFSSNTYISIFCGDTFRILNMYCTDK